MPRMKGPSLLGTLLLTLVFITALLQASYALDVAAVKPDGVQQAAANLDNSGEFARAYISSVLPATLLASDDLTWAEATGRAGNSPHRPSVASWFEDLYSQLDQEADAFEQRASHGEQ